MKESNPPERAFVASSFPIERLRVGVPCGESWDEMSGTDEVRFCAHCRHSVHDLSRLTRAGAEALVARSQGRLCVKYRRRPDGSVAFKEALSGARRAGRRVSLLASAALAALLGLFTEARAQQSSEFKSKSCPDGSQVVVKKTRREGAAAQNERATLAGTILDPNGAVIVYARISLWKPGEKPTQKGDEKSLRAPARATMTNEEGVYTLSSVEPGFYTLTAESPGFQTVTVENVVVSDGEDLRVDVSLPVDPETVTVGIVAIDLFPNPKNNLSVPIDKIPFFDVGRPDEE